MVMRRIGTLLPWALFMLVICAAPAAQSDTPSSTDKQSSETPASAVHKTSSHKSSSTHSATSTRHVAAAHPKSTARRRSVVRHVRTPRRPPSAKSIARSRQLQKAFVASSQLRPMAQELASMRTPAAYAGVAAYARAHSGEAGSAAYLALGHAYLLDHRYADAVENLEKARVEGETLDDYAVFLEGEANMQAGKLADAQTVLTGFQQKYPESIFIGNLPVVMANLDLGLGDPQAALAALHGHEETPGHADSQLALARAQQMAGNADEAARLYRRIFLNFPLSNEAQQAKTQLAVVGAAAPLTIEERRAHADALYAGGRYAEAGDEYRSLASDSADTLERVKNSLLVAAAACDLKLKRLSREQAESLPDNADESGARRLYLMVELARNRDDSDTQQALVEQMKTRFGASPWLAEALYTSGNMYLLRKDYPHAIAYYAELATRFPQSRYAPSSHWKAAWLDYQTGNYSDAARLIDEQLRLFPGGKEISAALYWRGRLYEDQEHKPEMAAAYYGVLSNAFEHYYYAQLARRRLLALGSVAAADVPVLANIGPETIPPLTDDVPNDDEHVVKAKLLANAGLNEYIPAEIQAADGSRQWGAFAEAQIYESYGEAYRAMQVLKRALPFYASAPIDSIPIGYWKILFPQPYWATIEEQSAKNNLDPYMVASLIRQESEFNASAVSHANAWGLMQLLPSVGRSMAKEEGDRSFRETQLLDPDTNIRLGTRYLGQILSKFGGKPEYAFAAYNAGDDRVNDWQGAGSYNGMDEFVESIPFTETREYVQAILRNEAIYRELNERLSATKPPVNAVAEQQ
jgi:soluble lytic murein transglycosylase